MPPNPFWVQLAWQLVQTPAVKQALGDRFAELVEGKARLATLQAGARALQAPDLQNAFRALTTGGLDQNRFTGLFAEALVKALDAAA
jgi:hypothetical protein